jgi:hypothetical protein
MANKRTFDMTDEVTKLWEKYEKECDASFSKMANNALLEYLRKKLKK